MKTPTTSIAELIDMTDPSAIPPAGITTGSIALSPPTPPSDPIKLAVEWEGDRYMGTVSCNEGAATSDEYALLAFDRLDLSKQTNRKKVIQLAVSKALGEYAEPAEIKTLKAVFDSKLMKLVEDRRDAIKKQSPSVKNKAKFRAMPDVAIDTDSENARRFAHFYGMSAKWCDPWGCWLVWDGRRWIRDERRTVSYWAMDTAKGIYDEVKKLPVEQQKTLSKFARESQNRNRLEAMLALARPLSNVMPEDLDKHDFFLTVENGTLDLRTGKCLPHDSTNFMTKLAPVTFNPAAQCVQWEAFIRQITLERPELIDYLQRLLGMCLTGDITYQALPILYGTGCNGKSTMIDVVKAIVGEFVTMAPDSLFTSRGSDEHPTEFAMLQGRRMVFGAESDEGRKLRTGVVKKLTGDDSFQARFMRGDFFTVRRTHKSLLVTNNRPRLSELDEGIRRRIKLIPFDFNAKAAGVEDPYLKEKLLSEKSGILNWLIEGSLRWQQSGMTEPEIIQAATQKYFEDEDPLAEFLEAVCEVRPEAFVITGELFLSYSQWAAECGNRYPLGLRAFHKRIATQFGDAKQRKVAGVNVRVFSGIGLRVKGGSPIPM